MGITETILWGHTPPPQPPPFFLIPGSLKWGRFIDNPKATYLGNAPTTTTQGHTGWQRNDDFNISVFHKGNFLLLANLKVSTTALNSIYLLNRTLQHFSLQI
jgi:hypothetical protein